MISEPPHRYRIQVEGALDLWWSDRLQGMRIETECRADGSITTLTGGLIDQAALQGVLNTLYELHLPILSTIRLASAESSAAKLEGVGEEEP